MGLCRGGRIVLTGAPACGAGASRRGGEAPGTAVAQAEAAPPPPAPPPPAPPPAPHRRSPPVPAVAAARRPTAATVTTTPATPAPDFKKINVGVAMRVGSAFHSATDSASQATPASTRSTSSRASRATSRRCSPGRRISRAASRPPGRRPGIGGSNGSGVAGVSASMLDLIAKFEPAAAFHLWAGRMLVPVGSLELQRPVVHEPLEVPGPLPAALPVGPVGPKEGPQGRNNGATVWGEFLGAKLKYYAGVFDMNDATVSPLFSGRVNICLLGSESGFYHSSTYYGAQDIVAIGLGVQYQKNGQLDATTVPGGESDDQSSPTCWPRRTSAPAASARSKAQYYHFDAERRLRAQARLLRAGQLADARTKIGVGKLQPLVRYQQATGAGDRATPSWKMVDAYLTLRHRRLLPPRCRGVFARRRRNRHPPATPSTSASRCSARRFARRETETTRTRRKWLTRRLFVLRVTALAACSAATKPAEEAKPGAAAPAAAAPRRPTTRGRSRSASCTRCRARWRSARRR